MRSGLQDDWLLACTSFGFVFGGAGSEDGGEAKVVHFGFRSWELMAWHFRTTAALTINAYVVARRLGLPYLKASCPWLHPSSLLKAFGRLGQVLGSCLKVQPPLGLQSLQQKPAFDPEAVAQTRQAFAQDLLFRVCG